MNKMIKLCILGLMVLMIAFIARDVLAPKSWQLIRTGMPMSTAVKMAEIEPNLVKEKRPLENSIAEVWVLNRPTGRWILRVAEDRDGIVLNVHECFESRLSSSLNRYRNR